MEGHVARRIVPVAVLTLVLLAGTGIAAVVAADGPSAPADADRSRAGETPRGALDAGGTPKGSLDEHRPPADATVTRIRVHANGTATWTVEIRTLLANDTDVEGYRRFQDRFRSDTENYLGSFRTRMTRLVNRAATVTDREMRAGNFTAATSVENAPRRWGVVTYRFRWEGFAVGDGDQLRVGDVFESGYYLTGSDSLVVEAPDGYAIEAAVPEPGSAGSTTARWTGPLDFADGRPTVRMVATDAAATDATPNDASDDQAGLPFVPAAVGGVLLVVGGLAAYLVAGRGRGVPGTSPDEARAPAAGGEGDGAVTGGEGVPAEGAPADGGAAAPGGSDDPTGDGSGGVPDGELVTNEEQVVALLERNGGRMRQADVADELDWSAPKTSRVLSSMAEDGDVEKLRLGNENVIDLADGE